MKARRTPAAAAVRAVVVGLAVGVVSLGALWLVLTVGIRASA